MWYSEPSVRNTLFCNELVLIVLIPRSNLSGGRDHHLDRHGHNIARRVTTSRESYQLIHVFVLHIGMTAALDMEISCKTSAIRVVGVDGSVSIPSSASRNLECRPALAMAITAHGKSCSALVYTKTEATRSEATCATSRSAA